VNTNLTRKVKPVKSPHEKAAHKARESAERAKARLDRARERQRFRSPGPPTAGSSSGSRSRSGTSPSRSRYLSEGSDSEEGSGRELVFVDGLTTIQSAMDSEGYQRKVNNSLREAREKINLMWARQGCKGHQVDSFYDMKEEQDIRISERALVSVLHCEPTRACTQALLYFATRRRSLYSALALATENSAWCAGERVARPLKHKLRMFITVGQN
jgi:hypothetical protein